MTRARVALMFALCLAGAASAAPPLPPVPKDIEEPLAKALFERAVQLFDAGRFSDARRLFVEAQARGPKSVYAVTAGVMIARCDEQLGGSKSRPERPRDNTQTEETVLDPYAEIVATPPAVAVGPPVAFTYGEPPAPASDRATAVELSTFGGLFGLWNGVATAVALDAGTETPLLLFAGGAVGALGGYYYSGFDRTPGQARALMSAALWGSLGGFLAGHVADDPADELDQTTRGYFASSLLGTAAGLGAGLATSALFRPSTDEVFLVDSLGVHGLTTGLLVAWLMQPAQTRAYSLNAILGASAGIALGVGLATATDLDVPLARTAWVHAGALAGLGAAALLFPVIDDANDRPRARAAVALAAMAGGAWFAWRHSGTESSTLFGRRASWTPLVCADDHSILAALAGRF